MFIQSGSFHDRVQESIGTNLPIPMDTPIKQPVDLSSASCNVLARSCGNALSFSDLKTGQVETLKSQLDTTYSAS